MKPESLIIANGLMLMVILIFIFTIYIYANLEITTLSEQLEPLKKISKILGKWFGYNDS